MFGAQDGLIDTMRCFARNLVNHEKLRISVVFVSDTFSQPPPRHAEQLREKPMPRIAVIVLKVILQKNLCDVEFGLLNAILRRIGQFTFDDFSRQIFDVYPARHLRR